MPKFEPNDIILIQGISDEFIPPILDLNSLDNIIWQPVPLCPEVDNVEVINTTETTATVTWTSTPVESAWDVSYGPMSATDPDTDNLPVLPATFPSPPYILL